MSLVSPAKLGLAPRAAARCANTLVGGGPLVTAFRSLCLPLGGVGNSMANVSRDLGLVILIATLVGAGCTAPERSFNRTQSASEAGTSDSDDVTGGGSRDDEEAGAAGEDAGPTDDETESDDDTDDAEDDSSTDDPDDADDDSDDASDDGADDSDDDSDEPDDDSDEDDGDDDDSEDPPDAGDDEADDDTSEPDAGPDSGTEPVITGCQSHEECSDGNVCNGEEECVEGECFSGMRADDWSECEVEGVGGAQLCLSGNCIPSICGDGYVDSRTDEECDDGNGEDGDGCEVGCRWSCSDASHCDDGNVCNGVESCGPEHVCVSGDRAEDQTSCGDDLICDQGRCVPAGCGNSLVEEGEDCDDGNLDDGDGCDSDCTWTCVADNDCDDGSVCTGAETCVDHLCVAGEHLECDDGSPCTDNACDPVSGCFYPLIDADGDLHASESLGACGTDCNDEDPSVYTGAGEICDGKDNNCDGAVDETALNWYRDCDGDTFAPEDAPAVEGCEMPAQAPAGCDRGLASTWTSRPPNSGFEDCYDEHAGTHPMTASENESAWGTSAAAGRPIGVDFDFNCDDVEEKYFTNTPPSNLDCSPLVIGPVLTPIVAQGGFAAVKCFGQHGWSSFPVPECGVTDSYTQCAGTSGSCTRVTVNKTQECR